MLKSTVSQFPLPINYEGKGDIESLYILVLDIGSTTIRAHVYNKQGRIIGASNIQLKFIHPKVGWFELNPFELYINAISVLRNAIKDSGVTPDQVLCIAIASERNTFVTWHRDSGQTFHNLITWQDLRASDSVDSWNNSFLLRALKSGSQLAYFFTRKKCYRGGSMLKFMNSQVTLRLLWVLDNIPNVRLLAHENKVLFGCIETWLLWKLTGGQIHATDFSSASSTGLFDPFCMEWSTILCHILGIPISILPEVRDTSGDFGLVVDEIFGLPIQIKAVVSDQQSSMFGHCCFNKGDVKCTMGTGSFIDVNTGAVPHFSIAEEKLLRITYDALDSYFILLDEIMSTDAGVYPLIGWKIGQEIVFLAESLSNDTGNVLTWAQSIGLFCDVNDTSSIAESVEDSGGVCFVPAFSGIQTPVSNSTATTCLFGISMSTRKEHIVRAILESLVFTFKALYQTIISETQISIEKIRLDGGVSRNNFLVQQISDILQKPIHRSTHSEMTSLGAAFIAGLSAGMWISRDQLPDLWKCQEVFHPHSCSDNFDDKIYMWHKAVQRSLHWYNTRS